MYQLLNRKLQAGIFLALLLLMSCDGSTGKPERLEMGEKPPAAQEAAENNEPRPVNEEPQPALPKQEAYTSCEALVIDLVRSSSAKALSNFKAVQVRIDDINPGKITIELYTINEVSEDPTVERMADRTVGWLEFFPATGKLQDITRDPDQPEHLQYNTSILQKAVWDKLCLSPLQEQ